MIENPDPPEKGCGWESYGMICYSFVGHKEGYHPMCMDYWKCTCAGGEQSSYEQPLSSHKFEGGK
jgi:hypothetical protein